LVHAATTASRGIRTGDGAATASSARLLRIYGIASALVVILGFGLMSVKRTAESVMPRRYTDYLPAGGSGSARVASFGDTYIWLSLVLWVVAVALVLAFLVPTLQKATTAIAAEQSVLSLTGRVAAAGGVVALLFAGIVFLMVYRPGG
ncbi:hypothetical protein, partial [Jatrophihabitans endophyticus]|uniref:hypothetical protein n=1 Tax=Jatrophihabitans endophyticus TaxID=1206085 RepID=UPI0019F2DE45